jgi:hypothetical protein
MTPTGQSLRRQSKNLSHWFLRLANGYRYGEVLLTQASKAGVTRDTSSSTAPRGFGANLSRATHCVTISFLFSSGESPWYTSTHNPRTHGRFITASHGCSCGFESKLGVDTRYSTMHHSMMYCLSFQADHPGTSIGRYYLRRWKLISTSSSD